ncbi:AraC family transcriptional regulator [Photobacterium damselae subsp. damselae]|uniref:helix-turn-helix domain-containing protein n=1 Tax=Photobacterium damselae TaxID=38293 RepID=UPI001F458DBB|nr:AraC family transcriptional regulator [Photobacterium damselae]UJZ95741.1 AraC family transcriptional regulator [Photobacterium damselae subsp. damselae]UKA00353.1 AraC family transcriptional regulator [Photobacterium damselae subsp. damselae]
MKRKARYMLKFTITPEILLTTKDFVIFLTKKNKILISDDQTLIIVEIKNDKKEKSFAFKNTYEAFTIEKPSYIIKIKHDSIFFQKKFKLCINSDLHKSLLSVINFCSEHKNEVINKIINEIITSSLKIAFTNENRIIDRIKIFITNNIKNKELSSLFIAEHFSISVRKLYYIFNGQDLSITQYIKHVRLEKLNHLLENHYFHLKKLQNECGFKTIYIMNNAYKKKYDISIKEKIKRYREH